MGFPSPANDFLEQDLNLQRLIVKRPSSTFFMKVAGAMKDASISTGDIVVIDRSLTLENNSIAVCWLDGEFVLKRIVKDKKTVWLLANENDDSPLKLNNGDDSIWGIVTAVIKMYR